MKTHTFTHEANANIKIAIEAYNLIEAVTVLAETVKYPTDFNVPEIN